jgi:hypothetical protein
MILTPTDWLLLTTTALGVVGTGYGQWKLRQERQAVARQFAEKEWMNWRSAQDFIDKHVLDETGFATLAELEKGYRQLIRAVDSSAGAVARSEDYATDNERLREFGMINTAIRVFQSRSPVGYQLRTGNAFDADNHNWEYPEIARLLHGLSLHHIAGLGIMMLSNDSSRMEETLVSMGLRKATPSEATC